MLVLGDLTLKLGPIAAIASFLLSYQAQSSVLRCDDESDDSFPRLDCSTTVEKGATATPGAL